jgi:hypothetical protein
MCVCVCVCVVAAKVYCVCRRALTTERCYQEI